MHDSKKSFILILLALVAGSNITFASAVNSDTININSDWNQLFYEGLTHFYKNDYKSVIDMVQSAIRTRRPGPGAHKCLMLMRLAFCRQHDSRIGMLYSQSSTPQSYSKSALKSFEELEKKAQNGVADRVILAAVKDSYTYHADVIKILEQIIDSDSPWRDWAYWKKAHSISRMPCRQRGIRNKNEDFGVIDNSAVAGHPQYILNIEPYYTSHIVQSRAARIFLKKNPSSYMRIQFSRDLEGGYLYGSQNLLSELTSHIKEIKFSTLNSKQQQALNSVLKGFNNIITDKETDLPAWIRINKLDMEGLLYDDIDDGDSYMVPRYLKAVQITEPKGTLPPHIIKWLDSLDLPPLGGEIIEPDNLLE